MSDGAVFAADWCVGVPPAALRGTGFFFIIFDKFASLNSTKRHCVKSSVFSCFNHEWVLQLYPRGANHADDGMASVSSNSTALLEDMYLYHGPRQ